MIVFKNGFLCFGLFISFVSGSTEIYKTMCTETGMHGFPDVHHRYKVAWYLNDAKSKQYWYGKTINMTGDEIVAACPKPISYQLSDLKEKSVSVDFQEGGEKMKSCGKNSDCGEDHFCGHAFNPIYCKTYGAPDYFRNKCMDKSNNGRPMQFCFKSPSIVNGNMKIGRDNVGFDVCNDQKDCGTGICILSKNNETYRKVDANGQTDRKEYHGICCIKKYVLIVGTYFPSSGDYDYDK